MILVTNFNFPHCLFLLKIGPEMMFGDLLDKKEALVDNKNMSFICPKNRKFSKGVFLDNKKMYLICPKNRKFSIGVKP